MRTPGHNLAKFDHDFVGREALATEIAKPKRTTITLCWNADDVLDTLHWSGEASPINKSTFPIRHSGGARRPYSKGRV